MRNCTRLFVAGSLGQQFLTFHTAWCVSVSSIVTSARIHVSSPTCATVVSWNTQHDACTVVPGPDKPEALMTLRQRCSLFIWLYEMTQGRISQHSHFDEAI